MAATELEWAGGTWCAAVELSDRTVDSPLPLGGQPTARLLVRLHGAPLGYLTVSVPPSGFDVSTAAEAAESQFRPQIEAHLREEGLSAPVSDGMLPGPTEACASRVVSTDLVSVVICTRDRSEILASTLERLRHVNHPAFEVLVVDNAPSDESARRVVGAVADADPRFTYVREPRPGASRARNAGLGAARGRYVAFIDDDVAVDRQWLQALVLGFSRRDDVRCVTGLVATAGIGSPFEAYFDARAAAWADRFDAQVLASDTDADPLFPYKPSLYGTGANCAFDRAFFHGLGGFDDALGPGTRALGGEDLDAFIRIILAGGAVAYEPAAVVWHHHRADHAGLMRQLYGYGTGLTAFLTKYLLQSSSRREVLRRIPVGLRRFVGIHAGTTQRLAQGRAKQATTGRPSGARRREALGLLAGPALYLRSRADARRTAAADPSVQGLPPRA